MESIIKGLSDSQIEQVRRTTDDILEDVGFRVGHGGIRELCGVAGAKVDEASQIVRLPRQLVGELLAQAPSVLTISDVSGAEIEIGGGHAPRYHAIVTDPWIINYPSGEPRPPCLDDVKRNTALAHRLGPVAVLSLMDYPVFDVEGPGSNLHAMRAHILHHAKHHLVCPASVESFDRWLRVGEILSTGSTAQAGKIMSVAVAVISPLILSELNGDLLMRACERDMAVFPTICATAGSTAPYSVAANILLGNVETIFLAAITQLVRPGTPFVYRFAPSVAQLRSVEALYYTLDKVKWNIASVQLGKSYGLPTTSECGGAMTWRHDGQTGAEGVLSMLAAHCSGADFFSGIGSTYNAVGMSPETMLIQTAWMQAAMHLGRGIDTSDDLLGAESIRRAGPGGEFLTDELTLELMRGDEFFSCDLLDYSGSMLHEPSMLERAHARVQELVEGFESPLPAEVQEQVRRFFRDECGILDE